MTPHGSALHSTITGNPSKLENAQSTQALSSVSHLPWLISSEFLLAPDEDICGPLEEYFRLGCSDVDITELLKAHYDVTTYGLR